MMKTGTSWRTVLPVEEAGRFTPQQLDRAVCQVMERRRSQAAARPMVAREMKAAPGVPSASTAKPVATRKRSPNPRPRRGGRRRKPEARG